MCFPRKPWLGRYSATRNEWKEAYRSARIRKSEGRQLEPGVDILEHKALLVLGDREHRDYAAPTKLWMKKLVREVLAEG